ncbi:DUF4957 domain-containing protein [Chryseotalea sanaruensis]|nr:DUF4957 domain-containing protein [Chryseotalea sanaruensis]
MKSISRLSKNIFIGLLSLIVISACEDNIDPVEELNLSRVLTPVELVARIRNLTTIELTWDLRDEAVEYVVEFSEDSLEFTSIIRTVTVSPDDLPLQEVFDGETRYSARVKGIGANGFGESNWATVTIMTAQENIFLPVIDGDIAATTATLRWPAGSNVTSFLINPGAISRAITEDEKAAGIATITGLTGETNYTVTLLRENKVRGNVSFETLIDIGDATAVYPEDDLNAVITAAAPGDALVLFPGDYTVYTGIIILDKSITISGLYPFDKPKVHVQFSIEGGATDVTINNLDIDGDEALNDVFRFNTAGFDYASLSINGSNIHDFTRSFIAGNVASTVASVSVDNCVLTNVLTSGGDFIDFRNTHVTDVSITNSTFNNCAPGRDFVRIDAAGGYTGTGLNTNVLIDHCTLFGVSNTTDRILYVRFNTNSLTVQNTLFAESNAIYTNQTSTSAPTFENNNYFNTTGLHIFPDVPGNIKIDQSGDFTILDPGFTNAAEGNFTITNQTLLDNAVGDPRWRQQ